ncbi:origin recognition complex, subunit 2 [Kipferlia bialata]|uniref:Origin recognition complex, subunit 2 n=1 Tax=Kipferlia bialata TaxID=797122 RepID=A0A9K3GKB5_9EUKA|nr:origin recognition complex, subunit 2 [Kipferlia bialata]|eukprot:g7118.t1
MHVVSGCSVTSVRHLERASGLEDKAEAATAMSFVSSALKGNVIKQWKLQEENKTLEEAVEELLKTTEETNRRERENEEREREDEEARAKRKKTKAKKGKGRGKKAKQADEDSDSEYDGGAGVRHAALSTAQQQSEEGMAEAREGWILTQQRMHQERARVLDLLSSGVSVMLNGLGAKETLVQTLCMDATLPPDTPGRASMAGGALAPQAKRRYGGSAPQRGREADLVHPDCQTVEGLRRCVHNQMEHGPFQSLVLDLPTHSSVSSLRSIAVSIARALFGPRAQGVLERAEGSNFESLLRCIASELLCQYSVYRGGLGDLAVEQTREERGSRQGRVRRACTVKTRSRRGRRRGEESDSESESETEDSISESESEAEDVLVEGEDPLRTSYLCEGVPAFPRPPLPYQRGKTHSGDTLILPAVAAPVLVLGLIHPDAPGSPCTSAHLSCILRILGPVPQIRMVIGTCTATCATAMPRALLAASLVCPVDMPTYIPLRPTDRTDARSVRSQRGASSLSLLDEMTNLLGEGKGTSGGHVMGERGREMAWARVVAAVPEQSREVLACLCEMQLEGAVAPPPKAKGKGKGKAKAKAKGPATAIEPGQGTTGAGGALVWVSNAALASKAIRKQVLSSARAVPGHLVQFIDHGLVVRGEFDEGLRIPADAAFVRRFLATLQE